MHELIKFLKEPGYLCVLKFLVPTQKGGRAFSPFFALGSQKSNVTLKHYLWLIKVFLFYIDLTLPVAMVTENGC